MENINVCCVRFAYDMGNMGQALDAMYDVLESGLIYDAELDWIEGDWDYHSIPNIYMSTKLDRQSFHIYADSGFYTRCALIGWSDKHHVRQVNVIWNSKEDISSLSLLVYAGIPCNTVEKKIAEIIEDSIPPFDV